MAQRSDDMAGGEQADSLDRAMKVTFDTEELHGFFDGFEPMEDAHALWERLVGET